MKFRENKKSYKRDMIGFGIVLFCVKLATFLALAIFITLPVTLKLDEI